MQDWFIALIMMMVYLVIALAIGMFAGRGRGGSLNEFVVAGGKLGMFVMLFLMGGAVLSAFSFLGAPGWAFTRGAPAYYIIIYIAFAILPWYLIGPKIGRIGRKYGLYTLVGFLQTRYKLKTLGVLVGIIALLGFIQYLATQMKGMAYIFNIMTDGRIPFWLGALLAYGIVVIYVATGGLRAAAWSDVFQGILMIVISWTIGLAVVFQLHGSPSSMFMNIHEMDPGFLQIGKEGSTMSSVGFTTTILVSLMGFLMWPHLFSKSYASRPKTIKKTVLAYPVFALFLIPLLLAGFAAVGVVEQGTVEADEILPYLITTVLELPGWLYGLVGAGALAAAMSSADAITHSASLEFTSGVVQNIKEDLSEKTVLIIMKVAVITIGGLAYFVTIFGGQGLIALLLGAYGSIVQFAPGVYGALYSKRISGVGVTIGLVAGTVINYYYQLAAPATPFDIHAGIMGLMVNILIVVVVSLIQKPKQEEVVEGYTKAS
ncbi:sodium:solute symporter family protein [Aquibacillus sediminis]|uniref:sodium:solute symporter family protein n=1 Tax=Aquibacillus sediminis TaxID=2574734 RepID=UPI0011095085|nr:sodium:solute symporter family protein [Aquibacillus sediminis]